MIAYARFIGFKGDHLVLDDYSDLAYKKYADIADKKETMLEEYVDKIFEEPLDIMTEVSAWFVILWKVEDDLRAYSTTLEEDLKLLEEDDKNHNLSYNERNCIMLRRNDKIILESIKD